MQLAWFLNNVFKKDGFILIDANSKSYIIGNPIIGNGSATIYTLDSTSGSTFNMTRPYLIEISFKLYQNY